MNYYELLNVAREADGHEIKRAYFSAVKLHSPDSDPEGFKAIRTAYETLSDQKKRAEYDSYFTSSGDIQNDLLAARNLIRENKYKQAVEFLKELSGKNPDSTEAKRLLAEVLWYVKKSGTADKLCLELLEKEPADGDTLLLRAKIAVSQGYTTKAEGCFNDAVNAAPQNSKVWIEYMRFAVKHYKWLISDIFRRASEQNPDVFRDEYIFYLVGAYNLDLFNNENKLEYYDKFAEYFLNDNNLDEYIYDQVMGLMPHIILKEELVPFVEKILPVLENSKHRSEEDGDDFKLIYATLAMKKLRSDKRIHDVLADLTGFILSEDDDKNERLSMECYIVFELSDVRPSIKVLRNEYPEYFKLNQAFYLDALNEKKEEYLIDKYSPVLRKQRRAEKNKPKLAGYTDGDDDDFDETDDTIPFVRQSPKVGRNDPCPCGSGKKYKKCCG